MPGGPGSLMLAQCCLSVPSNRLLPGRLAQQHMYCMPVKPTSQPSTSMHLHTLVMLADGHACCLKV